MTSQQQRLIAGTLALIMETMRLLRVHLVQLESALRRIRDIMIDDVGGPR